MIINRTSTCCEVGVGGRRVGDTMSLVLLQANPSGAVFSTRFFLEKIRLSNGKKRMGKCLKKGWFHIASNSLPPVFSVPIPSAKLGVFPPLVMSI